MYCKQYFFVVNVNIDSKERFYYTWWREEEITFQIIFSLSYFYLFYFSLYMPSGRNRLLLCICRLPKRRHRYHILFSSRTCCCCCCQKASSPSPLLLSTPKTSSVLPPLPPSTTTTRTKYHRESCCFFLVSCIPPTRSCLRKRTSKVCICARACVSGRQRRRTL